MTRYKRRIREGGPHFGRLDNKQLHRIHDASIQILERVGVHVYDEGAITCLKKGGARVEPGGLVRMPPQLVEWAISVAPKQFALYDRYGQPTITVGGYHSCFGTGSDCPYILDHVTGLRREATLADVVAGMRVCEALDNIDFVMSMFIPSDVPVPISDRYQMEAMLRYTRKPILFVTYDLEGARDAVAMAEAVAGGAEALRRCPQVCCFVNINAPLQHNQEAVQKIMFMAEKGLPCTCSAPMTTRGVTAPLTMAGCLALGNAGQLAGLVLSQLVREGTPQVPCRTGGGGLDMRTLVTLYASPEMQGFRGDLAHFYDLPSFGMAGCSDAKLPDEQALAEAALTILIDGLVGSNLIHDVGYLESGKTGSLEMLAMCDDLIGWVRRFLSIPATVDAETLALPVVEQVGPDGNFLDTEHTLRHFREEWRPRLMDRQNFERWQAAGAKSYRQRARDALEAFLKEELKPILEPEQIEAVQRVLCLAAERAGVATGR